MIATIVPVGLRGYGARMRCLALRLLALFALLMLPFGMAAAPAQAHDMHPAASTMPADHCPDEDSAPDSQATFAGCAMPCSAALPADFPVTGPEVFTGGPSEPSLGPTLSGIELEIATPPPKLS